MNLDRKSKETFILILSPKILAISHDKKELLVVELKRGRASDRVVKQIKRYMGFVKEELAE